MTEKITGQTPRPTETASARRSEAKKPVGSEPQRGSAEGPSAAGTGDTVNITHSGLLLGKLAEVVQAAPVVDADRVKTIKDAIASGDYRVDAQKTADNLLRFERDVTG